MKNQIPVVKKHKLWKDIVKSRQVYLMILPVLVWFIIFEYRPLYWLRIAFYDYSIFSGMSGSKFVGFDNFTKLFARRNFMQMLWNALSLNLMSLAMEFPCPIIFALILNEMRSRRPRKVIQTVSFLPHFISTVSLVAIVTEFLSPTIGLSADILRFFGQAPINFLGNAKYFRYIMVFSGIWSTTGWSAIVYLSALTGIDANLYEAALVDGANRWQRLCHITLPGILSTIVIMFILRVGHLLSMGYEKIYLLQNSVNLKQSEVLSTFVYKQGLLKLNYSLGTTAGMFNGVVSLVLVFLSNRISKRFSDAGGIF